MNNIIRITGLLIFLTGMVFGQPSEDPYSYTALKRFRQKALKENFIGKKYYYDLTHVKGCNPTCIRYLGPLETNRGNQYKILTSFYVHGSSCRGSSRIVIYDLHNRYLGNYYVTLPDDLPDTIINNKLVYTDGSPDCEFRKGKSISFEKGLPKIIFIPCKASDQGDSYLFSNDE